MILESHDRHVNYNVCRWFVARILTSTQGGRKLPGVSKAFVRDDRGPVVNHRSSINSMTCCVETLYDAHWSHSIIYWYLHYSVSYSLTDALYLTCVSRSSIYQTASGRYIMFIAHNTVHYNYTGKHSCTIMFVCMCVCVCVCVCVYSYYIVYFKYKWKCHY